MHAFALTLHFLVSCYVFTKYCIQSNSLDTEVQWKYAIFKKVSFQMLFSVWIRDYSLEQTLEIQAPKEILVWEWISYVFP